MKQSCGARCTKMKILNSYKNLEQDLDEKETIQTDTNNVNPEKDLLQDPKN